MQLLSAAYIRNLAVIGGGQMGTGIAQVAAIAGQQVLVLILLASRYWYCRLTGIETNSRRDCFKFQASLNKCRWWYLMFPKPSLQPRKTLWEEDLQGFVTIISKLCNWHRYTLHMLLLCCWFKHLMVFWNRSGSPRRSTRKIHRQRLLGLMRRLGGSGGKTLLDDVNVVDVDHCFLSNDNIWSKVGRECRGGFRRSGAGGRGHPWGSSGILLEHTCRESTLEVSGKYLRSIWNTYAWIPTRQSHTLHIKYIIL